jgi:hypothetical protein
VRAEPSVGSWGGPSDEELELMASAVPSDAELREVGHMTYM